MQEEARSKPDENVTADTTVYRVSGWRRFGLWLVSVAARLWGSTIHFELSDEAKRAVTYDLNPVVIILWHNRLFLTPIIRRRYRSSRDVYGLVSASRDGAGLAAFFDFVGIRTVRGSSSRFGREAVKDLIQCVRSGHDVAITPDGPRGPVYDFKAGATLVARRTRAPILLIGGIYESAWQLRSWDKFNLPKPFSTVRLNCRLLSADDKLSEPEIRQELMRLCGENADS